MRSYKSKMFLVFKYHFFSFKYPCNDARCDALNLLAMLNYAKKILSRVSFDARLFEKELRKAIRTLVAAELQELRSWCYANFRSEHEAILNRCFAYAG